MVYQHQIRGSRVVAVRGNSQRRGVEPDIGGNVVAAQQRPPHHSLRQPRHERICIPRAQVTGPECIRARLGTVQRGFKPLDEGHRLPAHFPGGGNVFQGKPQCLRVVLRHKGQRVMDKRGHEKADIAYTYLRKAAHIKVLRPVPGIVHPAGPLRVLLQLRPLEEMQRLCDGWFR